LKHPNEIGKSGVSKKLMILVALAALLLSADAIDELFLGGGGGPSALKWALMGPALLGCPAIILLMWLQFRKSRKSK
jgi:hypothetical protein